MTRSAGEDGALTGAPRSCWAAVGPILPLRERRGRAHRWASERRGAGRDDATTGEGPWGFATGCADAAATGPGGTAGEARSTVVRTAATWRTWSSSSPAGTGSRA